MNVGQYIRECRIASGVTLEQACQYLGDIDVPTLAAMEEGLVRFPADYFFALSNLYDIPPDEMTEVVLEYSARPSDQIPRFRTVR